jgi:hypothetical protein
MDGEFAGHDALDDLVDDGKVVKGDVRDACSIAVVDEGCGERLWLVVFGVMADSDIYDASTPLTGRMGDSPSPRLANKRSVSRAAE